MLKKKEGMHVQQLICGQLVNLATIKATTTCSYERYAHMHMLMCEYHLVESVWYQSFLLFSSLFPIGQWPRPPGDFHLVAGAKVKAEGKRLRNASLEISREGPQHE